MQIKSNPSWEAFFVYCSGARPDFLRLSPGEQTRFTGIGGTVFFTGVFAFFSGSFALFYVFDDLELPIRLPLALLFGLVWGLAIFNLDRFIVSSMKKSKSVWRESKLILPRLALAAVLALVISKPLELRIFHSTIAEELELMRQEKLQEKEALLRKRMEPELLAWKTELSSLETQLSDLESERNRLEEAARKEADGTGGSGQRGAKQLYQIKRKDADRAQADLDTFQKKNGAQIGQLRANLTRQKMQLDSLKNGLSVPVMAGFDSRLEALHRLCEKSDGIRWASWFIALLFMVLEMSPVLVKALSPRGPYDDLLAVHEQRFRLYRKEKMKLRRKQLNEKLEAAGVPTGKVRESEIRHAS